MLLEQVWQRQFMYSDGHPIEQPLLSRGAGESNGFTEDCIRTESLACSS